MLRKLKAPVNLQREREVSLDADVQQLLTMTPTQINARVDALMLLPNGIPRMFKILFRLLIVIARKNLR